MYPESVSPNAFLFDMYPARPVLTEVFMNQEIKLLTTFHCAKCKQVKKELDAAGISYIECPADDKSGIELVVKYRVMTAPALFIAESEDSYRYITDFQEILAYIHNRT